jgi:hypothetical protein
MERWEVVLASCRGLGLDDDKVELHCIAVLMLSSCARAVTVGCTANIHATHGHTSPTTETASCVMMIQ